MELAYQTAADNLTQMAAQFILPTPSTAIFPSAQKLWTGYIQPQPYITGFKHKSITARKVPLAARNKKYTLVIKMSTLKDI